jgi:cell shape-determining protein MreD
MMRKQKIRDERILAQKRKIGSDAFQILFYSLFLSVLVQHYMFNAPFSQYAVEIILLVVIAIYIVVRNIMVGNDLFESSKYSQKLVFVNSIIIGLVFAIINTTLNYIKLGNSFKIDIVNTVLVFVITFLCVFIITFAVFEILYVINKKRQKQIESKLNNEDNDSECGG